MEVPNEFYWMARNQLVGWYDEPYRPHVDISNEITMLNDPDALVSHLNEKLAYGSLSPLQHSITRIAVERAMDRGWSDDVTAGLAIYLIMNSPDYVIQK